MDTLKEYMKDPLFSGLVTPWVMVSIMYFGSSQIPMLKNFVRFQFVVALHTTFTTLENLVLPKYLGITTIGEMKLFSWTFVVAFFIYVLVRRTLSQKEDETEKKEEEKKEEEKEGEDKKEEKEEEKKEEDKKETKPQPSKAKSEFIGNLGLFFNVFVRQVNPYFPYLFNFCRANNLGFCASKYLSAEYDRKRMFVLIILSRILMTKVMGPAGKPQGGAPQGGLAGWMDKKRKELEQKMQEMENQNTKKEN